MSHRRTFAAFDFDGTLTRRDTLVPFLATVVGRTAVMRALAAESGGLARAAAGRGDRDVAKERVLTRVLAGLPHSEVATAGRAFGTELARRAITPEARDRIAWHRREGHDVVIVSASLDVYLGEVAHALGVAHLLCTGLDIDERGHCTGRLLGANCRGPEKATRLQTLFGTEKVELWAYGNSRGDDEMLALADHAVRARRGRIRRPT
ncbi:MAG: phosphatidylglycerophosphatase [Actinomycetota bacterium]|nr:phosphatidylglycerophosphatase [Actinomycetota bacterium]